jgi:PUA domain protein
MRYNTGADMRRWTLSKKDARALLSKIKQAFPHHRPDAGRIEVVVEENIKLYLFEGKPTFVEDEGRLFPHLKALIPNLYRGWLPYIVVDEGAVAPLSRGADLMRPGIVRVEGDFEKGDVVVIVEPTRLLPIAVHEALFSRSELEPMERGRVTKRLHHVGDRYWRMA